MSQSGNDRGTTTSPPGHRRAAKIALTTAAKLQQLRANNCEMTTFATSCNERECKDCEVTSQKLNNCRLGCVRFCAALWHVVSSVFRESSPKEVSDLMIFCEVPLGYSLKQALGRVNFSKTSEKSVGSERSKLTIKEVS